MILHLPCWKSGEPDKVTLRRQTFFDSLQKFAEIFFVLFHPKRAPTVEVPEATAHEKDVDLGAVIACLEGGQPLVQVFAPHSSDEDVVQVDVILFSGN